MLEKVQYQVRLAITCSAQEILLENLYCELGLWNHLVQDISLENLFIFII